MAETTRKPQQTSTLKVVLIILAVLVLEGATIGVTMWLTSPGDARGDGPAAAGNGAENELVELLVVRDKFPNRRTGRQVLYDTEIYITALQKENEEDRLKDRLDSRRAQIVMEIGTIIRRAEPSYFNEPTLATFRRQVQSVLDDRLGTDAAGEPVVQEVLITRCTPFRADF